MGIIHEINKKFTNNTIIEKIKEKIKPISPDSKSKKIWDICFVILTFINFFIFTFEMAFFVEEKALETLSSFYIIYMLKILNIIIYFFDIILNFLTGYHLGGTLVMEKELIRKHYISNLFFLDLFSFIPIFFFCFEKRMIEVSHKIYHINMLFILILKK